MLDPTSTVGEAMTDTKAGVSLFEQQRRLLAAIVSDASRPMDAHGLVEGGKLSPARRVAIYRHAYLARLIDCLRDDFPAVERALGADDFAISCRDYVMQHPSSRPTLNDYGRDMPAFLRQARVSARAIPGWVAELATLEWATVDAIHADATRVLKAAELGNVPVERWGELRLELSPSAAWFEFRHPVNEYLTAAKAGDGGLQAPAERASSVLVVRRGPDVWRLELEHWAPSLLANLASGVTLGDALGGCAHAQLEPTAVMRCFRDWIDVGLFAGFSVAAPGH